ncbi:MAG: transaldolase [Candidatus Handelsmanbacteria bacterium]|nr:transaldolase [Candidatus Handelsmanbacteria bacterium]
MSNPLLQLQQLGQSPWYDNIRRGLILSGELQRLIAEEGVCGLTSNPAIFEKAISGSAEYAGALRALARAGHTPQEIYEAVAIEDIQWAADLLLPVYEKTQGRDGFVSLEVSPHLAQDTVGTIEEGLRLAGEVGRANLMIKVPGTQAGVPAIEHLIGEGISVNVTLLFSGENYLQVAQAYLAGLEKRAAQGGDLSAVASVASFFISRIDSLVDKELENRLIVAAKASQRLALRSLAGKAAIANAKLTYASYQELCAGPRWQQLAAKGARPQRLLWASTSTKNPAYRDVIYVEELIGAETVNTMPDATLRAFRDHGAARPTLGEGLEEAREVMAGLEELGVSMPEVTRRLQEEAVRLFVEPFDKLLAAIASQREAAMQPA